MSDANDESKPKMGQAEDLMPLEIGGTEEKWTNNASA
jgi:hypothetical protein